MEDRILLSWPQVPSTLVDTILSVEDQDFFNHNGISLRSISRAFFTNIKAGDILFLNGELGVGKTVFAKYLINFLQITNNQSLTEVPSPTFSLINEYTLNSLIIKHCDFYRLKDEKELDNLGIFENNIDQIILIEWPKIIKHYRLKNTIDLFFEYDEDYNKRFLTLSSTNNISYLNEFK